MPRRTRIATVAVSAALALTLAGCAGQSGTNTSSASPSGSATEQCGNGDLATKTPGVLTIATDSPAYSPYFEDNDPSNGKGFESAVAYAIAGQLGYAQDDVEWVVEPFNRAYAPGDKDFDFDINQVSITPKRAERVDFSDGYYTVNQAVVALTDSPIANATTIQELREARLGAQVGTTSLEYIKDVVQPTAEPLVFNDTNDAKSALQGGQIDGIVVDLPTAYFITATELKDAKIVGQFPPQEGGEQFGLLMQKGSPLVACVNWALDDLRASGQLQKIQDQWLSGAQAPYFLESGTTSPTP